MKNILISKGIDDITSPMVYAYYMDIPDSLAYQVTKMFPDWIVEYTL